MQKKLLLSGVVGLLAIAVACGGDNKAPVSPSTFTTTDVDAAADGSTLKVSAPTLVSPANDATTDSTTPTLVAGVSVGRFVSAGVLVYRFVIETAAGTVVYAPASVSSSSSQVSLTVPAQTLAYSAAYRWRARAEQGSAVGPWSAYRTFATPAEPPPPGLSSPANGSTASSVAPNLVVTNGGQPPTQSTTALEHRFAIETAAGVPVLSSTAVSGSTTTTFVVPAGTLQALTAYRWRARAERGTAFVGPWSPYWTFATPAGIQWPTTTAGIVAFVAQRYPAYLAATSSLHQREVNMAFIRDRMIEAGICGGLDLAWNLKRGVGPRSTDALLHRDGSRDRVIDIAAGFDDYWVGMRLHWIEVAGPPGYDRYLPRPTCQ